MRIDLDRMEALGATIAGVHQAFSDAERLTDDWRGAVGHSRLADRLDDFSGNWDATRANMLEGIENMGQLAHEIASAFRDADRQLAAALDEAASPDAAQGRP